jgi:hypothetical protein
MIDETKELFQTLLIPRIEDIVKIRVDTLETKMNSQIPSQMSNVGGVE